MTVLLTFILFAASISLHELGHAVLMRRYGVAIKEIRLFGFGRRLFTFRIKYFGDTPISLGPLPIGAFARPEGGDKALDRLSDLQKAHTCAGGIAANLIFGGFLGMLGIFSTGIPLRFWTVHLTAFVAFAILGVAIWVSRRAAGYLMLFVITLALTYVTHAVLIYPLTHSVAGPIGTGIAIAQSSTSYFWALITGALVSLGLGVTNALPFLPLDGGHIKMALLKRHCPLLVRRYDTLIKRASVAGAIVIFALAFSSDVLRIWSMF